MSGGLDRDGYTAALLALYTEAETAPVTAKANIDNPIAKTLSSVTGFVNDTTTYKMTVTLDGSTKNISVVGSEAQTVLNLIKEINADLDSGFGAGIISANLSTDGLHIIFTVTDTLVVHNLTITDGTGEALIGSLYPPTYGAALGAVVVGTAPQKTSTQMADRTADALNNNFDSNSFVPTGTVIMYAGSAAPTAWLLCTGAATNFTTYTDLGLVCKSTYGLGTGVTCTFTNATEKINKVAHGLVNGTVIIFSNTGGALPAELSISTLYYVVNKNDDDFQIALTVSGSPITFTDDGTGTSKYHIEFLLPDFRGVFPKGAGTTNRTLGKDANGSFYTGTAGTYATDQMQGHYHVTNANTATASGGSTKLETGTNTATPVDVDTGTGAMAPKTDGSNGTPRVGVTTEPQSLCINFIIKT